MSKITQFLLFLLIFFPIPLLALTQLQNKTVPKIPSHVISDSIHKIPPQAMPTRPYSSRRGQSSILIGGSRRRGYNQAENIKPRARFNPGASVDLKITALVNMGERQSIINGSLFAGILLPYSLFHKRDYKRIINNTMTTLKLRPEFHELFESYFSEDEHIQLKMITFNPSPEEIQATFCDDFLPRNISAIIYLSNNELYGSSTAASKYFLQLASNLGLPVIACNADNSGLGATSSSQMVLQLAPSIHHQAEVVLSILKRYNWHQFAIVTSQIAGNYDFVQAVRDLLKEKEFEQVMLMNIVVMAEADLSPLVRSEVRILLLYSTKNEASWIMKEATKLGLTGSSYVWIVTQSVIGETLMDIASDMPLGMLGIHFNTTLEALKHEISNAIQVFVYGVYGFQNKTSLKPSLSCNANDWNSSRWKEGANFYKTLSSVVIDYPDGSKPPLKFNADGTLANVELQIMNLRPGKGNESGVLGWEQVGLYWRNWRKNGDYMQLDIKDVMWPGRRLKPPNGLPEKILLKIISLFLSFIF